MKVSAPVRVYGFAPKLAPAAVTAGLAVLAAVPVSIPEYAAVTPGFALMSLFHWTLYRPEYLGYGTVFLIGLFVDLLTTAPGTTVGLTPLILLVARWAIFSNRRFFNGRTFPFVWMGFSWLTAGVAIGTWTIASMLCGVVLDPRSMVFQAILTIALFPGAEWLMARLQRWTEGLVWPN